MPDLRIRDVAKTYSNGFHALQGINLNIPPGMYGLLAPNGGGKSTLMRTIATLQEPDRGEIHLGSLDVLRQKDEVRKTLGYLPQEFGDYPKTTAERLLNHFAVLRGITRRGERRDVVSRDDLAALEREQAVISTKLLAGRTLAHVFCDHFCDHSPGQGLEAVAPDLEDVFFSAMSGHDGAGAMAPA